jgi:hypothetical protein
MENKEKEIKFCKDCKHSRAEVVSQFEIQII